MILGKLIPCQLIQIWQPRWKDRKVLIAKFRVGTHNEIVFTKTKSMPDKYYLSGETIKKYPLETNGRIQCYAVHMDELEVLERE
jgi:hypothetical protein